MTSDIPTDWQRGGLVIPRGSDRQGGGVAGDPCIVWDETIGGWRMVLFYSPPGHAQAVCRTPDDVGPGRWELEGPLTFTNPEDLLGGRTHKPFYVLDAARPGHAACLDGRYLLLLVSYRERHKVVQRAHSTALAGPWTVEPGPLIDVGPADAFDADHVDAVTGYWFADRREFLYCYMGYPLAPQPWPTSPFGSAQAAAVQALGEAGVRKLGVILPPCEVAGHWASGWVGGLQLLPGREHPWVAVCNASPTAPRPQDGARHRQEPPPSLGGFASCTEAWPVSGWHWCPEPLEWIEDLPAAALAQGEGVNLWRQYVLGLPDGRWALFYNSGTYGQEQLYLKMARR